MSEQHANTTKKWTVHLQTPLTPCIQTLCFQFARERASFICLTGVLAVSAASRMVQAVLPRRAPPSEAEAPPSSPTQRTRLQPVVPSPEPNPAPSQWSFRSFQPPIFTPAEKHDFINILNSGIPAPRVSEPHTNQEEYLVHLAAAAQAFNKKRNAMYSAPVTRSHATRLTAVVLRKLMRTASAVRN